MIAADKWVPRGSHPGDAGGCRHRTRSARRSRCLTAVHSASARRRTPRSTRRRRSPIRRAPGRRPELPVDRERPDHRREGRPRHVAPERPRPLPRRPVQPEARRRRGEARSTSTSSTRREDAHAGAVPSNNAGNPFSSRLILLPTGQVLHTNGGVDRRDLHARRRTRSSWKPSITSVPTALLPGFTVHASRPADQRPLAGGHLRRRRRDGDELSDRSMQDPGTGAVIYCRTHDHSTMGIQTGAVDPLDAVHRPADTAARTAKLRVIANGISSDCVSSPSRTSAGRSSSSRSRKTRRSSSSEHEGVKLVFEDLRRSTKAIGASASGRGTGARSSSSSSSGATRSRRRCAPALVHQEGGASRGRSADRAGGGAGGRRRRRRRAGGAGATPEAGQEAAEEAGPRDAEQASCSPYSLADSTPPPAISSLPGPRPEPRSCRPRT